MFLWTNNPKHHSLHVAILTKIWHWSLLNNNTTYLIVSKDLDLWWASQVLHAYVLLFHHSTPAQTTQTVMNPHIWLAHIFIIEKAINSVRHVRSVDALTLQPLRAPWLQRVRLLEYGPDSYLKINRPVRKVPDLCGKSSSFPLIHAPIKTQVICHGNLEWQLHLHFSLSQHVYI